MFGSEILDVAIGLVLIYLLLSLFATAVREGVESLVRARAVHLERGIRELLDDPTGAGLARQFYEHPLIYSLYRNGYTPKARRRLGGNMPNYIPSRSFATALLDLALRGPAAPPPLSRDAATQADDRSPAWPYAAQQTSPKMTEADLRAAVSRLPSVRVQRALLTAIDGARGDPARVQANLEEWFDGTMDRVSGWYRRRTQYGLFLIGFAVTAALNVNTVTLANYLARNKAARETLVARAAQAARDSAGANTRAARPVVAADGPLRGLDALDLPIGWGSAAAASAFGGEGLTPPARALVQLFGLLLTALAITLGAPFWFDALNRMMVVRSTVKPKEKSPEEASEDRQKPARPAAAGGGSDAAAARPPSPPFAPNAAAVSAAALPAALPAALMTASAAAAGDPAFVPQRWAVGDPDEGVL